jgi:hypothetical protein
MTNAGLTVLELLSLMQARIDSLRSHLPLPVLELSSLALLNDYYSALALELFTHFNAEGLSLAPKDSSMKTSYSDFWVPNSDDFLRFLQCHPIHSAACTP